MTPRKIKRIDGVDCLYCKGDLHKKGKWVPISKFYKQWNKRQKKYYYRSVCKSCLSAHNSKRGGHQPSYFTQHGYVPVADIRPWLKEIIKRCGGIRPAGRAIGCHHSTILLWLREERLRYVQRNSAGRILRTLQELRNGTKVEKRLKPGPKEKRATLAPGEKRVG